MALAERQEGRGVTRDELKAEALRLRAEGLGDKAITRRLNFAVSESTVARWVYPGYAERQRASSNAAKRRRTGTCQDCGAPTRYNGHGVTVSDRCHPCANRQNGLAKRGHGRTVEAVLAAIRPDRRLIDVCAAAGVNTNVGAVTINRLLRYGLVERVARGRYRRTDQVAA